MVTKNFVMKKERKYGSGFNLFVIVSIQPS